MSTRQRRPKGLTTESVRDQLDAARRELHQIDMERDACIKLIAGFEGWLRLYGQDDAAPDRAPREGL